MTASRSPSLLRTLAAYVQHSATARIGSAQRRDQAECAKAIAAELGTSSFAKEATSAALLACMVALAWNANKAANQRRLRHANRNLAHMLAGSTDAIRADRLYGDLDAECKRTYDAANSLRTGALRAARALRDIALAIELGS